MDKKLMTWGLVGIIIVLVLIGLFWLSQNNYSFVPQNNEAANNENEENAPEGSTPSTQYPIVASTLSYTDAVRIYGDRRIQFNDTCVPTPASPTFKKNTTIMLDNRANKTRTVSLDGKPISLGAYGYKLVTLTTSAPLPHTIMVDCGNGQNNASILLQQ